MSLQLLFEIFLILRRTERDMIIMYWSSCKVPIILYFRTVHVVIFILFKPTQVLFLKHIHIHI